MSAPEPLRIETVDEVLTVSMPPSGNRWIVGLGLFAGIPWLLLFLVGSIAVAVLAPPDLKRNALLGVLAANLLFFIVHILAVAGVWLAFYNLRGTERLIVEAQRITVARSAMGITVPMRLRRTPDARVAMLDLSTAPGKSPHQRLEVHTAGSAMRFGAGLDAAQAAQVQHVCAEVLGGL